MLAGRETAGLRGELEPDHAAVQIVGIGAFDLRRDDLADAQRTTAGDIERAIDLRRVGLRTALRYGRPDLIDDDLLPRAYLALQPARGNLLLPRHQRVPALLLDILGHRITERIRRRSRDRLILEAADPIDLGLHEPVEQIGEIGIGLAGKTDDERRAQGQVGALLAPSLDSSQRLVLRGRAFHGLEDFRAGVLKGNIEIGQDFSFRHQTDDVIDMRVGVDILQPHPGAEFAELLGEVEELRAALAIFPGARGVFQIDAIGGSILRNDQQFPDAGADQLFRLTQHIVGGTRHQVAAQFRDDTEAAAVVAAFGNLQVGVVPRGQLDALRRYQIEVRIMNRRQRAMHRVEYAFILLRSRDRQHAGIGRLDLLGFGPHAARHNHLAIRGHRFADRTERFLLGAVEKAAGVDDDEVGAIVLARQFIAFRAQPCDDALGIHQRLGATQRNKTDFGRGGLLHVQYLPD